MDASDVIAFVGVLFGIGGVGGFFIALVKLRPEAGQMVVTSAQGALIVQDTVLKTVLAENERLRKRVTELETQVAQPRTEMRANHNAGGNVQRLTYHRPRTQRRLSGHRGRRGVVVRVLGVPLVLRNGGDRGPAARSCSGSGRGDDQQPGHQRCDADVAEHEPGDGQAAAADVRLLGPLQRDVAEDHGEDGADPEHPNDAQDEGRYG
nr:hypothetical protein [Jiangella alkaliphila]